MVGGTELRTFRREVAFVMSGSRLQRLQEPGSIEDSRTPMLSKRQQMPPVPGDEVIGGNLNRALKNPVVGVPAPDHLREPPGFNDRGRVTQRPESLGRELLVPTELAPKHPPATSSRMKGDRHNSNRPLRASSRTTRSLPGKFRPETMTLVSRTTLIYGRN